MNILRSAVLIFSLITPSWAASETDTSNQDFQSLIAQGERYAQTGDLKAALQAYEMALAEAPHSSEVRLKLAGLQVLNGSYRDSIGNFQRVIRLDPDSADAFVGMGIAYLHLGDYSLARAALQEALNRDENKREDLQRVLDWMEIRAGEGSGALPLEKPAVE